MSRYVQRCARCSNVRGLTSFKVTGPGTRSPICKWCQSESDRHAAEAAQNQRNLKWLYGEEAKLAARLAEVRRDIRHWERVEGTAKERTG